MDPKYLHDTRKKLNDLAISHNRLTTLCACLLNEVQSLKREMNEMKGIRTVETSTPSSSSQMRAPTQPTSGRSTSGRGGGAGRGGNVMSRSASQPLRYDPSNIAELRADEILQQISFHE
jgi:hypothetical protein